MRILVTGAGGYVGEELCKSLSKSTNVEIIALIHSKENSELLKYSNIIQVKGSIEDKDFMFSISKNIDQVYHIAAYARSWSDDPRNFYSVNVGGTINLIEGCLKNGVKKIVITSTAGTIGPSPDNSTLITEEQYRRIRFFGDYEMSKIIADERIHSYVRQGMDIVTICPTRIFGPGNSETLGSTLTTIIRKYIQGKWHFRIGKGRDNANYVYIDDVIKGLILAMQNGKAGEKYIIGSFNSNMNDLLKSIDVIMGRKSRFSISIPIWLLLFYAFTIVPFARMFKFDPVITYDWIEKIRHNWAADITKAQEELNYMPTKKEDALRKTIDWANGQ